MTDEPNGAALLAVARRALLDDVAPALTGRPRFVALMVANALRIAASEFAEGDAAAQAQARLRARAGSDHAGDPSMALAQAVRAGRHDADADLYGALVEATEIAARIWKPASP